MCAETAATVAAEAVAAGDVQPELRRFCTQILSLCYIDRMCDRSCDEGQAATPLSYPVEMYLKEKHTKARNINTTPRPSPNFA